MHSGHISRSVGVPLTDAKLSLRIARESLSTETPNGPSCTYPYTVSVKKKTWKH